MYVVWNWKLDDNGCTKKQSEGRCIVLHNLESIITGNRKLEVFQELQNENETYA